MRTEHSVCQKRIKYADSDEILSVPPLECEFPISDIGLGTPAFYRTRFLAVLLCLPESVGMSYGILHSGQLFSFEVVIYQWPCIHRVSYR